MQLPSAFLGLLSGAGVLVEAWWVVSIFCQCRPQMLALRVCNMIFGWPEKCARSAISRLLFWPFAGRVSFIASHRTGESESAVDTRARAARAPQNAVEILQKAVEIAQKCSRNGSTFCRNIAGFNYLIVDEINK